MPSNHLIFCRLLLLLPSIFPRIRIFSNESALCIRWPKYWSCSFNISPSNEHSGLISFRMDWLDLLTVQGTLKSLLQHHSSKTSILRCSAFFIAPCRSQNSFFFFFGLCWVLTSACGIFICGMCDLVPQPGIKIGPHALGVWSLNHWTTSEVPQNSILMLSLNKNMLGITHPSAVTLISIIK